MKKVIFIFCLFAISIHTNSQSYNKLIRTNTYWDVYYLNMFWYDEIDKIYFTGIDTILDGNHYQLSREYPYESVNPGNLLPPFFIDSVSIRSNVYLREDTLLRKVYIYDENSTPHDQVIYDFSLSIGDTLHSDYVVDCFHAPIVVLSIDTVNLLNGDKRKRFNFHTSCNFGYYIEGIGGSQGLFGSIATPSEYNEMVDYFCITENDTLLWNGPCQWFFVGEGNLQRSNVIKIKPNPAHDFLEINLDKVYSYVEFSMINLQGKEMLRVKLDKKYNLLSLPKLSPGIYFYQLKSDQIIKKDKLIIF